MLEKSRPPPKPLLKKSKSCTELLIGEDYQVQLIPF